MGTQPAKFGGSVPVLVLKLGRYPLSHGILGAVRSLGRAGVPVHAVCEDRFVPYAFSRYLSSQILLPTTSLEEVAATLLDDLARTAKILGTRSILLPTDDEAAIFVAEHATELRHDFIVPLVDPRLPRALASKRGLSLLCRQHDVAMPATHFARSVGDVLAFAETANFPIVVKNSEPWIRITAPAVRATTIVASREALVSLARNWTSDPHVVLQEYIPEAYAEDWIFHAYFDSASKPLVAFTGLKQRSWPPYAGVTAAAIAWPNPDLATTATEFCRAIGYRGIVDMDWRLDLRDNRYKLVDFNPRLGANFRLFVSETAVDVVRAQYLDLTGQAVPMSAQSFGRRLIVENLNLASRIAGAPDRTIKGMQAVGKPEFAWFAADDPLPFLAMALRFCGQVVLRLAEFPIAGAARLATRRSRASLENPLRRALTSERATDRSSSETGSADKPHQSPESWSGGQPGEVEPRNR
jgi:predicted ATP-grasp superfamily ATP-dependent carboligase